MSVVELAEGVAVARERFGDQVGVGESRLFHSFPDY
jgi:hypothetical protein